MPWVVKALNVLPVLLMQSMLDEIEATITQKMVAVYSCFVVAVCASTLPALFHSVRDRHMTTTFIVTVWLYTICMGMAALTMFQYERTKALMPFTLQMLLCHGAYCITSMLKRQPRLLLFSRACTWLFFISNLVLPLIVILCRPRVHIDAVFMVVLFAGELCGTVAAVGSLAFESAGNAFENFAERSFM